MKTGKMMAIFMAIYVVSGAILVYFLSEKIEKIQSNNRQLKSEKQELLEEYVELLKSTEKIDSLINERSASVKKQEILIYIIFIVITMIA